MEINKNTNARKFTHNLDDVSGDTNACSIMDVTVNAARIFRIREVRGSEL
jgi:hypothetical protein